MFSYLSLGKPTTCHPFSVRSLSLNLVGRFDSIFITNVFNQVKSELNVLPQVLSYVKNLDGMV